MAEEPFDLARHPVHLGLGATVEHLPEFDGSPQWYERYGVATALFVTAGSGTGVRPR